MLGKPRASSFQLLHQFPENNMRINQWVAKSPVHNILTVNMRLAMGVLGWSVDGCGAVPGSRR